MKDIELDSIFEIIFFNTREQKFRKFQERITKDRKRYLRDI